MNLVNGLLQKVSLKSSTLLSLVVAVAVPPRALHKVTVVVVLVVSVPVLVFLFLPEQRTQSLLVVVVLKTQPVLIQCLVTLRLQSLQQAVGKVQALELEMVEMVALAVAVPQVPQDVLLAATVILPLSLLLRVIMAERLIVPVTVEAVAVAEPVKTVEMQRPV